MEVVGDLSGSVPLDQEKGNARNTGAPRAERKCAGTQQLHMGFGGTNWLCLVRKYCISWLQKNLGLNGHHCPLCSSCQEWQDTHTPRLQSKYGNRHFPLSQVQWDLLIYQSLIPHGSFPLIFPGSGSERLPLQKAITSSQGQEPRKK